MEERVAALQACKPEAAGNRSYPSNQSLCRRRCVSLAVMHTHMISPRRHNYNHKIIITTLLHVPGDAVGFHRPEKCGGPPCPGSPAQLQASCTLPPRTAFDDALQRASSYTVQRWRHHTQSVQVTVQYFNGHPRHNMVTQSSPRMFGPMARPTRTLPRGEPARALHLGPVRTEGPGPALGVASDASGQWYPEGPATL